MGFRNMRQNWRPISNAFKQTNQPLLFPQNHKKIIDFLLISGGTDVK